MRRRLLWVSHYCAPLTFLFLFLVGCGGAPPPTPKTPFATQTEARATPAAVRPTATALSASSSNTTRADIPAKVSETLRYVETHNGQPPPGYVGGTTFDNRERRLPQGRYKEYDVDPKMSGVGRNAERLVIEQDTGRAYYTADHYDTFTPVTSGR